MNQDKPFKEKLILVFQKLKNDKRRSLGILLIVLGIAFGVVSRAVGGNPFQNFTAGILMGLSAGVLLVGILLTLLSRHKNKAGKS